MGRFITIHENSSTVKDSDCNYTPGLLVLLFSSLLMSTGQKWDRTKSSSPRGPRGPRPGASTAVGHKQAKNSHPPQGASVAKAPAGQKASRLHPQRLLFKPLEVLGQTEVKGHPLSENWVRLKSSGKHTLRPLRGSATMRSLLLGDLQQVVSRQTVSRQTVSRQTVSRQTVSSFRSFGAPNNNITYLSCS